MITETKGYKTVSKGGAVTIHVTLEAAQEYSIADLLCEVGMDGDRANDTAELLMKQKSELLTILTGQRGKDKVPRKRKATQEATP